MKGEKKMLQTAAIEFFWKMTPTNKIRKFKQSDSKEKETLHEGSAHISRRKE